MKQSATYRDGGRDNSWRRLVVITVTDQLGSCDSYAYEVDEFPGVVRWFSDHKCVPMYLCEKMGWRDLEAQQTAITNQRNAYETLMSL